MHKHPVVIFIYLWLTPARDVQLMFVGVFDWHNVRYTLASFVLAEDV
jgi:hypothetical protein